MRIKYSKLSKELKFYRNTEINIVDSKDNFKSGNLILTQFGSTNEFINFYNDKILYPLNINGYHEPKFIKSKILHNRRFENQNQLVNQKTIKETCKTIRYAKPYLKNYSGLNTFYNMSFDNECFNKVFGSKLFRAKLQLYKDFLIERIRDISQGYNKVFMVIKPTKALSSNDFNDFSIMMYYLLYYDMLTESDFKDIEFLFYADTPKIVFKIKISSKKETNFRKFSKFINILAKLNSGEQLSNDEQTELLSDENNEKVEPDTEIPSNNKAINPAINKVIDAPIKDKLDDKPSVNNSKDVSTNQQSTKNIKSNTNNQKVVKNITQDELDILDKIDDEEEIEINQQEPDEPDLSDELKNNDDFLKYVDDIKKQQLDAQLKEKIAKKVEVLKQKQDKIFNGEYSVENILHNYEHKELETEEIKVETLNHEIKHSKLKDMDKNYNEFQFEKDVMATFLHFNEELDFPMFVTSYEKTNTSDEFSKKETLDIALEDVNGVKHNIKIDIPTIIDDSFMYLNNGKKTICKQLTLLPILKTAPDTVQVTSSYSKMFLTRYGRKVNSNIDKLRKFITKDVHNYFPKLEIKTGNNKGNNNKFINTLEFEEISSFTLDIKINNKYFFNFNRNAIEDDIFNSKVVDTLDGIVGENEYPIGYSKVDNSIYVCNLNDSKVYCKTKSNTISSFLSIYDCLANLMGNEINPEIPKLIAGYPTGKRFMYTRVAIIGCDIPLVLLMGFYFGLEKVLKAYNINYEFSEKRINEYKDSHSMIEFDDGFLYVPLNPIRNGLLVNGLTEIPTKEFKFHQFNDKEIYLNIFELLYGSRNKSKGFYNFITEFLDPITINVLDSLKLPTKMLDILLYGNTLLEDTTYSKLNNINNYRIRSTEIIAAHLYEIVANGVKEYKDAYKNGQKKKIFIPQDKLIKKVLESPLIDEYSVLNPVLEAEKLGSITFKGLTGINLDQAFTTDIREYDKSMVGCLGINTPDSDKVGVVRQLSYNPKIMNNRGIINGEMTYEDMTAADMMTPAELLSPFTNTHADPPRIGMQVTQAKHVIPTAKQSRPLFGTGMEKTLPYILGSDFVYKAKQDGIVEKIDEKLELMTIKYKDGTTDVVDLSPLQSKNSNGGFYITNKKEPLVKVGQKFKKSDLLAVNPQYFLGSGNDVSFTSGLLTKIAMHSGDYTLEDSSIITNSLSKKLTSKITMMKEINLPVNTNIISMKKKGEKVKTGEPILVFEHAFQDADANTLLDGLSDEYTDILAELGTNKITSKYTGEIVDIKIFYNKEINEFLPNTQKVIKSYIKEIEEKRKIVEASDNKSLILPATNKLARDKIGNNTLDGLYIQYFIRYEDELSIGDKISFFTAIKTVVADVIADEEEPYTDLRPDEPIEAVFSPLSVVSRMTNDIFNAMYLNKVLIELKRKVGEIYKG